MSTFAVSTLGCKVNSYESQAYIQGLLDLGYEQVDFKEVADIYLINTCAVTNTAGSKSRQKIHQAAKQNPQAFIVAVGCYVQTSTQKARAELNVDLVIGSDHKHDLAKLIDQAYHAHEKVDFVADVKEIKDFEALPIHQFYHQTRAYLKVQDGCNQFCSYCIIPYARGRERSLNPNEAIRIAKQFCENKHSEIVLAGIHTGRYGHDINTSLTDLLKRMLNEVEGLKRIRISSIEINECSDELIELMANEPRIAAHLHVPVQSCSNRILKLMNRPYTIEEFIERVNEIRKRIKRISISTDIIVGFPSESDADFQETVENLKKLNFSFMHVFPYSKRSGTKAELMVGHLNGAIKKSRAKELNRMSKEQYARFAESFIGQEVEVLFETMENDEWCGHSSEYLPVAVKSSQDLSNSLRKVIIEKTVNERCYGRIKEDDEHEIISNV